MKKKSNIVAKKRKKRSIELKWLKQWRHSFVEHENTVSLDWQISLLVSKIGRKFSFNAFKTNLYQVFFRTVCAYKYILSFQTNLKIIVENASVKFVKLARKIVSIIIKIFRNGKQKISIKQFFLTKNLKICHIREKNVENRKTTLLCRGEKILQETQRVEDS